MDSADPAPHPDGTATRRLDADLLGTLFDGTREGIIVMDGDGALLAQNAAALDLWTLPRELGASTHAALVVEALATQIADPFAFWQHVRRAQDEPPAHVDVELALRDGRVLEWHARPLAVAGRPRARVWSFRDVTERARARAELSGAAERLAEAQRLARTGSFEWDAATDTAAWSDELYRIYGVRPESFVPRLGAMLARIHSGDRADARAAIDTMLQGRAAAMEVTIRVLRPDGDERTVHLRARVVADHAGRPVRLIGTQQDVTEQHRAHLALAAAEQRLRTAFGEAPIAMAILDLDGHALEVNRSLCDLTGRQPAELLGDGLASLLDGADGGLPELAPRRTDGAGERITAERTLVAAGGQRRWVRLDVAVLPDAAEGGRGRLLAHVVDLTDLRQAQERLARGADLDPLTGLANAAALARNLRAALEQEAPPVVLCVDLDDFKVHNDALGRDAGDALLVAVADQLRAVPGANLVVRLGGDRFVLVSASSASEGAARELARRARGAVRAVIVPGEAGIALDATVGIVLCERHATVDAVVREAEAAARRAKRRLGDRLEIIDDEDRRELHEDARLLADLRHAIDRDELRVAYQPVVDVRDGRVTSIEALLRWRHPELGEVLPQRLVALAERGALIHPLGDWVLRQVCRHVVRWRRDGLDVPPVSINVSARQVGRHRFATHLLRVVGEAGLPPEALLLELTDSAVLERPAVGADPLRELHDAGFRLVLDDFGTRSASLARIHALPVEALKVDRTFVADLPDDREALAIVEAIVGMGGAMGLEIIAKGVRTPEQLEAVRGAGCSSVQGWLLSRALEEDRIAAELAAATPSWIDPSMCAEPGETITLGGASDLLGVSTSTLRRWADSGRLPAIRTEGGHRRFRRADVDREAARRSRRPRVRPVRAPEAPMPRLAVALAERGTWVKGLVLRAVYEGDEHGWFGTPRGSAATERWLATLAETFASGDYERSQAATAALVEAARSAGVSLAERLAVVDAVAQALGLLQREAAEDAAERASLARLVTILRRVPAETEGSPGLPRP
ncbi:MAG TPA: EAL domain-containing protein [Baekduia sp.]|nr:EAL domain-containing protein [Baekduia sp.]